MAIKARPVRWVWCIKRWKVRMERKVAVAILEGKSQSDKYVLKWEDNDKIDLQEILKFFKLSISCISDHCIRLLKPT
jgi:hypothetical protein